MILAVYERDGNVYERVAPEVTGVARVFTRVLSGGRRRAAEH